MTRLLPARGPRRFSFRRLQPPQGHSPRSRVLWDWSPSDLLSPPFALSPHALGLVIVLALAMTHQGAYYLRTQYVVGALLLVAIVAAVVLRGRVTVDLLTWPTGVLVLIAVWACASAALAGRLRGALPVLGLIAGVLAILTICRRCDREERNALVSAALTIGVLSSLAGWAGVAWRVPPFALEHDSLWRASSTLTYANATAGVLAVLALVSLARLTACRDSLVLSLTTFFLLLGLSATLSRAGLLAFGVGIVVLAILLGPYDVARAAVVPAIAAALGFAGLSLSIPAVLSPRPGVAFAALFAGLVVVVVAAVRGASLVILLIGVVVLVSAVLAEAGGMNEAMVTVGERRWSMEPGDRGDQALAAVRLFQQRPVFGVGPGNAKLTWEGSDGTPLVARYVHNEYLQVLVELGAIGLGLVATLFGVLGATVAKGKFHAPSPDIWAGIAAGFAALVFHSAFEFLWHVPALPLLVTMLLGVTFPTVMEDEVEGTTSGDVVG
jgi:O-antigen ligase